MRYVGAEIILSGGAHKMKKILWILLIPGNTGFVSQLDYTCLSHPLVIPYGSWERNTQQYLSLFRSQLDLLG